MEQFVRKNRLSEALNLRGMRQVDLVEKTGIDKASINGWVKQRWQPKQRALSLMARALDVSEMWLAGYDVPMERPEEQKINDIKVDVASRLYKDMDFLNLVNFVHELSPEDYNKAKEMLYLVFKKA